MAKGSNQVLLGFQDELITEKYAAQVHFMVNKIGGQPNLPDNFSIPDRHLTCNLCKLQCPLIVQIYATIEPSGYHRTLYLFACINSNCWNRSESWKCLRIQTEKNVQSQQEESAACAPKLVFSTEWCSDADNWGEDDNNANLVEENCNTITSEDKSNSDDEESSSFDESMRLSFGSLSVEDTNANNGAYGGGKLHSPMATAEIEGDEGEVITVETPTTSNTNLIALMQESLPLPQASSSPFFVPYFMSVWPEEEGNSAEGMETHVKELLADYQRKDSDFNLGKDAVQIEKRGGDDVDLSSASAEEYEKSTPLHGDKCFHYFVSKIKANPEQFLRYNRDGAPLLLAPLQQKTPIKQCQYCQGELSFEFQLIPTIISKLRLDCDSDHCSRLEFGTVLVYTCKDSCWSTNDYVKEEVVVVQKEIY